MQHHLSSTKRAKLIPEPGPGNTGYGGLDYTAKEEARSASGRLGER